MGLSRWSGRSVFWVPLVSSKLAEMLCFKGYLPLPLTPVSHCKREQRIFCLACMLTNECIHTVSRSSAWASSRSVAWAALPRSSLFLLGRLCWIKVTVHCSWYKLIWLTFKITRFTIKSCKWCFVFHNHHMKKIKCASTHHFHELLPKIQRSVKLIKLGHVLGLIILFQLNYSIQLLLELFPKFVLDLTALVSHSHR